MVGKLVNNRTPGFVTKYIESFCVFPPELTCWWWHEVFNTFDTFWCIFILLSLSGGVIQEGLPCTVILREGLPYPYSRRIVLAITVILEKDCLIHTILFEKDCVSSSAFSRLCYLWRLLFSRKAAVQRSSDSVPHSFAWFVDVFSGFLSVRQQWASGQSFMLAFVHYVPNRR
jgi:hypothetical protein